MKLSLKCNLVIVCGICDSYSRLVFKRACIGRSVMRGDRTLCDLTSISDSTCKQAAVLWFEVHFLCSFKVANQHTVHLIVADTAHGHLYSNPNKIRGLVEVDLTGG